MLLTIGMKMVETLTSKKPVRCITVSTLKGNTLGILEKLSNEDYDYAVKIDRKNDPTPYWLECDTILLGVSSYQRSDNTIPEFPRQLKKYKPILENIQDKTVVLFGSGRSEYPLFCGVLDALHDLLKVRNNVVLKYKFEGYPKESQKQEFADKINKLIESGKI